MSSRRRGPVRRLLGLNARWGRWYAKRDNRALLAALLFPLVGIAVLWLADEMSHTTSDLVLVTLLLAPVAIYLIGTQRLKELSGPGGISIKLEETVSARMQAGDQMMIWTSMEEIQLVEKGEIRDLPDTLVVRR